MPPVVVAVGVPLVVMTMVLVVVTIMILSRADLTEAAIVPAQEARGRRADRGRPGYLPAECVRLLAHRDKLLKFAPVQPHALTPRTNIDGNAEAFDFLHPIVTHRTLHRLLSIRFD